MRIPFAGKPEGNDSDSIVSWLEEQYTAADSVRRAREPDWYNNIMLLAGNHWEAAAADIRRYRSIKINPPQAKSKITNNLIYSLVRQAAAALRDNLSAHVAVPSTSDASDVMAAELATDFLMSRFYEDNEYELRMHEILWAMCCGSVVRKTYYNPEADSITPFGELKNFGDIATEVISPFKFHLCPWCDSSQQPVYIIESDVRDIDEINELYKPSKPVKGEDCAVFTQFIDRLLTNIIASNNSYSPSVKRKNAVILKRLYASPNIKNPKGKMFVWAGGTLLQEEELPEGELPFTLMKWFPIPGMIYSLPFISPLRDLQKEINVILSQIVELKNRQLRGDIVVQGTEPPTQIVDESTGRRTILVPLASQKFEMIRYDMNTTEAEMLLARLWNEMMQLSGIHESSIGQTPQRETTATQIMALKEADLAGLSMFRSMFDNDHCDVSRKKLLIAKNHYKLPRMIRLVGEGNQVNIKAFFGSDFRNTSDVRPRSVPLMSETAVMQMRRELAMSGLFGPYAGPDDMLSKVIALLASGLPGIDKEVNDLIKPYTLATLKEVVGQINAKKTELMAATIDAQIQQAVMPAMLAQQQIAQSNAPAEEQVAGIDASIVQEAVA